MKFAICGDSWFSSDLRFPEQSFGEIISHRKQWELISLAKSGCSNFCIALQIDKAIEMNADVIVLGATSSPRMEIPIIKKNQQKWQTLKELFSKEYWFHSAPSTFDSERGLSNVAYDSRCLSSKFDFLSDPTIVSESMNNLLFDGSEHLTKEQMIALKDYMLHLYDDRVKRLIDAWILSDACRRLIAYGRPWLFCVESLREESQRFSWLNEDNILRPEEFQFGALPRHHAALFHYCPKEGAEKFADHILTRLERLIA